jgi:hypothetical protein
VPIIAGVLVLNLRPLVSVGITNRDKRVGAPLPHFGPRQRKAFSRSSIVEPGLKAHSEVSLSTRVCNAYIRCLKFIYALAGSIPTHLISVA